MDALLYAQQHYDEALERLKEFLRIPSISTLPDHRPDVQRAAEWLAEELRRIGFDHVTVSPTGGHPVVVADWLHAAGKPTLLLYGHYDVQPADPYELWASPPFDPTERNGNLYARGAADDKGQVMIQLAALDALMQGGGPPVNMKVLFEGEEEIASTHLAGWVSDHRAELRADVCVISDTTMVSAEQPAITYGLRGATYLEVHVESAREDVHSGLYGGAIHNPIIALSDMLGQLHDDNGTVTVPGFYDSVRPLEPEEREEFSKIPFDEQQFVNETGITRPWGEKAYTIIERTSVRPTLEVHGIWGGFSGPGVKMVLPARAGAKLSCRTVPDQDPREIARLVREHLLRIAPPTVRVTVDEMLYANSAIVSRDIPGMVAATDAYQEVFGRRPLFIRGGGSLPVVTIFKEILDIDCVLMGFALPDDAFHAPNEKFSLDLFKKGIATTIKFYEKMGGSPTRHSH